MMSRKASPKASKKSADNFYDFYLPCLSDRDDNSCISVHNSCISVHNSQSHRHLSFAVDYRKHYINITFPLLSRDFGQKIRTYTVLERKLTELALLIFTVLLVQIVDRGGSLNTVIKSSEFLWVRLMPCITAIHHLSYPLLDS